MGTEGLAGKRFGRLLVVGPSRRVKGYVQWRCICDCGEGRWVDVYNLRSGHTKSCGCLHREIASKINATHGGTGTRLHNVWRSMLQRCSNPNLAVYKYYGGKGVRVCEEWRDFGCFRRWAERGGYRKGLTIDRVNSDGDYSPANCRWVSLRHNIARPHRRLTDNDASSIRKLYRVKFFTQQELAALFAVGRGTIRSIVNNKTYKQALEAM